MARTELPNGIILPAEYSDDWYDDMTSNLSKLDEVIGSDADKLSVEDVGAAALSNDYTDLDNKPDLKPVATSGDYDDLDNRPDLNPYDQHLANTDIHVTTADKTKWNNGVTQAYVLRYSSTAITDNSTIAYSTLDNTDNIKADDKIIDVDGKIFSIVSVDSDNSTVTVGTALVDLALDANVVHTNKNDDVSIPLNSTSAELGVTGGNTNITFLDKNDKKLAGLTLGSYGSSKLSFVRFSIFDKDANNNEIQDNLEYAYVSNNSNAYLRVGRDNFCNLGSISTRWKGVYAQNYYYGNNNIEFSTKFVTSDATQTISGAKTFSNTPVIYNSDTSGSTTNLYLRNQLITKGDTSTSGSQIIRFSDSADKMLSRIQTSKVSNGNTTLNLRADTVDTNNNDVTTEIQLISGRDGSKSLSPQNDNAIDLGRILAKWKNIFVNQINGLTPSSLSLPSGNANDVIDISSYITDLSGNVNNYTAPANGWISIAVVGTAIDIVSSSWSDSRLRASSGNVRMLYPVLKNETLDISVTGTTLSYARFIPCQGNV